LLILLGFISYQSVWWIAWSQLALWLCPAHSTRCRFYVNSI